MGEFNRRFCKIVYYTPNDPIVYRLISGSAVIKGVICAKRLLSSLQKVDVTLNHHIEVEWSIHKTDQM